MSNQTSEWQGMPHEQIEGATNIPAVPAGLRAPNAAPIGEAADGSEPTYSQVNFHGNYGALCGQYQEFTRYNITESQISQIGWAAFGTCGWNADRC